MFASAAEGKGPRFGADELDLQTALVRMRPAGAPSLRIKGGASVAVANAGADRIAGAIAPPPAGVAGPRDGLVIDLRGSYGGARETLWTAKGRAEPDKANGDAGAARGAVLAGRIARRVAAIGAHAPQHDPGRGAGPRVDGGSDPFGGDLAVVGLSLQHEALAAVPVENVSLGLSVAGTAYPIARRLELERAEARVRDFTARLSGSFAMPPERSSSPTARRWTCPEIELTFTVPKMPCAKLLASIPPALVPQLQGFVMQGTFDADVGAKIDFANLEALELRGKVGIDGCKVLKAPAEVTALAGTRIAAWSTSRCRSSSARRPPDRARPMAVIVGPDNPDFVPYDEISPYLVGSIMTTEDNGFFKHRGWVTSEFKSALRRNLQRGGFRLGASSITMQMVKNVLLTQEKTLSRKLQELFLVWYIEQQLPKERILELYFNAIEFGPRIYGIGTATRHYFGKKPSELTPLEAAFFSSILPSPKRRYIQYCHGTPLPRGTSTSAGSWPRCTSAAG